MTKTQQDLIDEIMDWFDFESVHKAMVATDWAWWDTGVPLDVAQVRNKGRKAIKKAITHGYFYSGGFEATYDKSENLLTLKFIMSDWEAYD